MVEATSRKLGISFSHVWFADELQKRKTDISIFYGMDSPSLKIDGKEYWQRSRKSSTLVTDLNQSEEELWNALKKKTKYEIRRAEKEGVTVRYYSGHEIPEQLFTSFENTYNQMFLSKGMPNVLNQRLVKRFCDQGLLVFSISFFNDKPLVYHSYIVDEAHTELLYSCSNRHDEKDMASLIGWTNRYLHWSDYKFFKQKGIAKYDWGGVNSVNGPSIAAFKMEFGGEPINHYTYTIANNIVGKAACLIRFGNAW